MNDNIKVFSCDQFLIPKVQKKIASAYGNPFNWFKSNEEIFTHELLDQFESETIQELSHAARESYEKGFTVVIDTVICDEVTIKCYEEMLTGCDIAWVLVYCPLQKLIPRVMNRNATLGITEQRSMMQALYQFSLLECAEKIREKILC